VSPRGAPDPRAALVAVPRALLGSSIALLAVAVVVHVNGRPAGSDELDVISWMAVAWAVLAPLVATAVRRKRFVAPSADASADPDQLAARLQKTIVFFGVLQSAVVFAAAALIVSPVPWPLAAACVPLAVMMLNLPPRAA
jgi:hypothetical protein